MIFSPPPSRATALDRLAHDTFDVLVVGGGIVGSGVARDAAQRGLRTALVDRYDFAYGTSSRSSRLLHGGLRYLEQGRLGLVREASLEKRLLADIAPHLGQPLGFVFPTYRQNGRPLWQLRIGVKLYDLLCNGRNFGPSRGFSPAETLQQLPALERSGLLGAVRYFDALTNDARLVLDTLRSAVHHGATIANRTRFLDAQREDGLWRCRLRDESAGREFSLHARTVVNASGPWAEGLAHSAVKLRLSKGIHIVVDHTRVPVTDAVVIAEGKRILFLIPWGERVIIGTTDTDYPGAPEDVTTEEADVVYLLRTVNASFPAFTLTPRDVISTWAGVRPLIAKPDGSPSDISRAHQILSPQPAWWDVAGGKLTTYRLMAEQTIDAVTRHLGVPAGRCQTATEPLLPVDERKYSGIVPPPVTRAAVEHFLRKEWASSLEDVMVRRSGWHYYYRDAATHAETVATWMTELAGWPESRRNDEISSYLGTLAPH